MHCQCHFGKVKSSSCSSVNTRAAATLRYAVYRTGSKGYHKHDTCLLHHDLLWKSMILECIHILQLALVNWRYYKF